jgi:hypothetical protein
MLMQETEMIDSKFCISVIASGDFWNEKRVLEEIIWAGILQGMALQEDKREAGL